MAVEALQTLRDLIAIPSVNPMRPCPGEAVEREVADYIESVLRRAGIETVVCGPGDIAQAHTKDEYVEVEQLERAARLYARVIEGWPGAALAGGRD